MNQTERKISVATLSLLSVLLGIGGMAGPAFAHSVTSCVVSPTGTIQVPSGGSTVLKVTITYTSFSLSDWPMTVTINPITAGYTANSSSFSDSGSGTHTFFIKITNTNPAVLSGTGTITVIWAAGSSNSCGNVNLQTHQFPPPPTVPEFPLGLALLMAVAIPALLFVKSKRSSSAVAK